MKSSVEQLHAINKEVKQRAIEEKKSTAETHELLQADMKKHLVAEASSFVEVEPIHHATHAEELAWRKKTGDKKMSHNLDDLEVSHAAELSRERSKWTSTMSHEKDWEAKEQAKLAQYMANGQLAQKALSERADSVKAQDANHKALTKDFSLKVDAARSSEAKRDAIRDHQLKVILDAEDGGKKRAAAREIAREKKSFEAAQKVEAAKSAKSAKNTKKSSSLLGSVWGSVEGAFGSSLLQDKDTPEVMPNFTQFYEDDGKLHQMEDEQTRKVEEVVGDDKGKFIHPDSLLQIPTEEILDQKTFNELSEVESDDQNKIVEKQTEVGQVLKALGSKLARGSLLQTGSENDDDSDLDNFDDARETADVEKDLSDMYKQDKHDTTPALELRDAEEHDNWQLSPDEGESVGIYASPEGSLLENPRHQHYTHKTHKGRLHQLHRDHESHPQQHQSRTPYGSFNPTPEEITNHHHHYPGLGVPGHSLVEEEAEAEKDMEKADSLLGHPQHHHQHHHWNHDLKTHDDHTKKVGDPLTALFPSFTSAHAQHYPGSLTEQEKMPAPKEEAMYFNTKDKLKGLGDLKKELLKELSAPSSLMETKSRWAGGEDSRVQQADEDHHFNAAQMDNSLESLKHEFDGELADLKIPTATVDGHMRTE